MENDLISRSELLKEIRNKIEQYEDNLSLSKLSFEYCEMLINNAPTVEQPQGEWIKEGAGYKCSRCGERNDYAYDECLQKFTDRFCPNCGTAMIGKEK